jgi:hypothetical protein
MYTARHQVADVNPSIRVVGSATDDALDHV